MSDKQRAIVVGAVVTGILSSSYLALINVLCCLGVMIGAVVTAQQYAATTAGAVETGDGALLGAGAGALGAVVSQLLDFVLNPLDLGSKAVAESIFQFAQSLQPNNGQMPMDQMMQQADQGLFAILVSLVFTMIIFAIFGAIGGAIGAAIFGSDDGSQTAQTGTVQQPPEA